MVELRSGRSDVFPAPTPTAGTFPSSLPFDAEAGAVGSEDVGVTPVGPVVLARIRWMEMGSDNAIYRPAAALALCTISGLLCRISTIIVRWAVP